MGIFSKIQIFASKFVVLNALDYFPLPFLQVEDGC